MADEHDFESQVRQEREWRFLRNAKVRRQAQSLIQKGVTRLDDQIFINRNPGVPSVVKFHPFTSCIAVADKDSICFWDWEKGEKLDYFHNGNPRYTRITAMEYLNGQDCSLLLTATGRWYQIIGHCWGRVQEHGTTAILEDLSPEQNHL
ncbi:hypothetical protein AB205_0045270 [Aquarana catesbeiana]|uniref:Uncharacterized protein n=1 Tax=Aquarana catesbeiana TaxID=8400 RepID=A0A2G9RUC7_AQUCT|nr:hypothetical protein AB205_0045270 [Aquarana catesbeiana]